MTENLIVFVAPRGRTARRLEQAPAQFAPPALMRQKQAPSHAFFVREASTCLMPRIPQKNMTVNPTVLVAASVNTWQMKRRPHKNTTLSPTVRAASLELTVSKKGHSLAFPALPVAIRPPPAAVIVLPVRLGNQAEM